MTGPYRESAAPASALPCPRCGDEMPGADLTGCVAGCGIWIDHASVASLMEERELAPSRVTSWFRERAGCPACGTTMTLRGHDMSLFLGCDTHGFWLDGSIVNQTSLARPSNAPRLAIMRARVDAVGRERAGAAERERALAAMSAAEKARLEAQRREEQRLAEEARREAERQRIAALREAKRQRYLEMVRAVGSNPGHLVDELMRLDDVIEKLAARVTQLENTGFRS